MRSAIEAAAVRAAPDLPAAALAREIAWFEAEARRSRRGNLIWVSAPLGVALRDRLAEAQNWRCCWCGCRMERCHEKRADQATVEHIVPVTRGGSDHPDNLAVACRECNWQRGCGEAVIYKQEIDL